MAKESMPRGAFFNMHWCMHFADDWEEEDGEIWIDSFADGKVESNAECAWHRQKFAIVKDACNRHWKEAVTSGRRLTMDESRTPGWYHGPITQGPEPKPVRTSPEVLQAASGLMWRGKDNGGSREMKKKVVPCPAQTKEYCEMFHLIDKGNGKEAKYDMARKSRSHNWAPKLVLCMFNMAMSNAYVIYKDLIGREGNGRDCLKMGRAVRELAHDLCQRGTSLRTHAANHPAHLRDMNQVEGFLSGTKNCNNRKFAVPSSPLKPTHAIKQSNILAGQQRKQPWRVHQSLPHANQGKCCWMKCPGLTNSKAKQKHNYDTYMRCKECSVKTGCNFFVQPDKEWRPSELPRCLPQAEP